MQPYCRGSGNYCKPETRTRRSGPQVRCQVCGRWLQQPEDRPRSVPAHKAYRYVTPMDRPVSGA